MEQGKSCSITRLKYRQRNLESTQADCDVEASKAMGGDSERRRVETSTRDAAGPRQGNIFKTTERPGGACAPHGKSGRPRYDMFCSVTRNIQSPTERIKTSHRATSSVPNSTLGGQMTVKTLNPGTSDKPVVQVTSWGHDVIYTRNVFMSLFYKLSWLRKFVLSQLYR